MASRNPEIREIEHLLQVAKTAKDNSKTSSLENMLKLISDEQLEKDRELADALSTYLSKEALHAQLEAEVVELSEKHAVVKDLNAQNKEIIAERQSFNEMYNIYSLKETEPKEFIQQHGNGIETLTNTLKALNEENDTLSEELKGIEEQNQLEMSKQTETINKIQRDIEESTENNKLLDEAINSSNEKLKQLKTEFEEKEKQRIAAVDENKQQQELLEKKKPEIEDKEKEYATKEAELNEKHAEIDEKLEEIRMQADENKTINENQSEILLRLQEELNELGKDLPEDFSLTQQDVDLQLEELQQNKQKLSELQSICESATITLETIKELDVKMAEVQEQLTSTQAEFDEIKNDLIKKETALNSELKTLVDEKLQLENTRKDQQSANSEVLKESKNNLDTINTDYNAMKVAYKRNHSEYNLLKNLITTCKKEQAAQKAPIAPAKVVTKLMDTTVAQPEKNINDSAANIMNSSTDTDVTYNGVKVEPFDISRFKRSVTKK